MKRAKVLSVSICMVLMWTLLLTACSGGKQGGDNGTQDGTANKTQESAAEGQKVTITYWNMFSGGDGAIMNQLVKQFNDEHQGRIEVKALTQDWGQFYTKLQTAVSGGNAPDLAISHTSKLAELVDLKIIEPMDPYSLDWSGFNENMLKATMFDGKHYAMPIDAHPLILYYNKKILRDLNLLDENERPVIDPGPDGFKAFLQKIKDGAPKGVVNMLLGSSGEDPYRVWWALYNQLGGQGLFDESGKKVTVNNQQGKQAAAYVADLFSSGLVPKNLPKIGETFQAGKGALLPTGVWFTGTLEATKGLEFGAIPFPQIYDKPATWIDSHSFILPVHKKGADENKVKASLTFAKWVTDHAAQWAKAGHIPPSKTAIESEEFKNLPLRQDYLQAANDGVYMPQQPKLWPVKDQLVQALETIWTGKATVDQGLQSAEQNMQKILAR
ncbi:ABC transporter substrate-binding protein [Paenibacillus xerothermodurans]|uniref:ABC transporter substrate-binding protein n=1 Tax=Paenibacillus xerothermodurans TaxID=1977292 RepID=A0A2W1NGM6_PAEXE|nr:ABC transporter substrate-binding protein [Paenibacillus xerothermodurans]PZE22251.1 ABC transporter substrate-binding protein [Paenibacillus xerothermodurans]